MPFQKKPPISDLAYQLNRCNGNVADVARHYGASRRSIYNWIEEYSVDYDFKRECRWTFSKKQAEARTA